MSASTPSTTCAECAHPRSAHEHYRRGTDCALCTCTEFAEPSTPRWYRGLAEKLRRRFGS